MDFIYDDLDAGPPIEIEYSKLQQNNAVLHVHIHNLETDVKRMSKEIAELKSKQHTLEENMSSLFKTARNEIERKNRMIDELNRRIDELVAKPKPREDAATFATSSPRNHHRRYRSRSPRSRSPSQWYDRGRSRGGGGGFGKRGWTSMGRRGGAPVRDFHENRERYDGRRQNDRYKWRDTNDMAKNTKSRQADRISDKKNAVVETQMDLSIEDGEVVDGVEESDSKTKQHVSFPPLRRIKPENHFDWKPEEKETNCEQTAGIECRQPNKPAAINKITQNPVRTVKDEVEQPLNYILHAIEMQKMNGVNVDECKKESENQMIADNSKNAENDKSIDMENESSTALISPLAKTPSSTTQSPMAGKPRPRRRCVAFKMLD